MGGNLVSQSTRTQVLRILVALLGISCLIWAQAETGQITGTVTDPTGAIVPGALVRIVNAQNGAERTTTASGSGDFAVTNLLPAQYTVTVSAPGFSTYQQNVTLTVGAKLGVDVKMQIGQTGTTVQVSETAVQVNTETQTLSTVVSQQQLTQLPTLTRNPYALVATAGNVADQNMGRGVGFAINGQRAESTDVLLDGAANNDEFSASVGQAVPLDSVQEFSVLTNDFTAEYGRAGAGVVNVVTKSGTNEFHGSAYEFNRVSALSSNSFDNNAKSLPKSVFTRNQFGYAVGRPIKKDKLFFFSSTEWIRIRSLAEQTVWVPTPQLIAASSPNTQGVFQCLRQAEGERRHAANVESLTGLPPKAPTCAELVHRAQAAGPSIRICRSSRRWLTRSRATPAADCLIANIRPSRRVDYNLSDKTQMYAPLCAAKRRQSGGNGF